MSALLQVRAVTKQFGGLQAVGGDDGLSFNVEAGSFTGLIGPNGAGKSTTFNLISGVLTANTGSVVFDGVDVTNLPPEAIAEMGIGRTFQTPRAFESLSVLDNVVLGASNPGERLRFAWSSLWRKHEDEIRQRAIETLERVGLWHRENERVSDLSGGELRMLEVARQLVRKPKLLLLDEPTAGVDPKLQKKLEELLSELHGEGMTLVVVEHNLHFLLGLADSVVVLTNGKLLTEGSPEHVRSDPAVIAAYLGGEYAA